MKRRKKKRISAGGIFFTIIIVFLSLILVGQGIYIMSEMKDSDRLYYADEDDYIRNVTYEDYYRVLSDAIDDCYPDTNHTETEKEIRALGYYYEAATLYKAYTTAGDQISAEKQHARMERYRTEAGNYADETTRIDELLELS